MSNTTDIFAYNLTQLLSEQNFTAMNIQGGTIGINFIVNGKTYSNIEYYTMTAIGTSGNNLALTGNFQPPVSNVIDQITLNPNGNSVAMLVVQLLNNVYTLYDIDVSGATQNTYNDGAGNMNIVGTITTNGISTVATAQTTVTVGTSPYTYTNTSASNQEVLIYGGTISAITFIAKGGTAIDMNTTLSSIVLRVGDALTITYSSAPTINTIQL